MTNEITFQDTIEWATMELERKMGKTKGIPIFYFVIGSVTIIILIILIVYLVGREPESDTIDMMTDDNYVYQDVEESEYETVSEIVDESEIED